MKNDKDQQIIACFEVPEGTCVEVQHGTLDWTNGEIKTLVQSNVAFEQSLYLTQCLGAPLVSYVRW